MIFFLFLLPRRWKKDAIFLYRAKKVGEVETWKCGHFTDALPLPATGHHPDSDQLSEITDRTLYPRTLIPYST